MKKIIFICMGCLFYFQPFAQQYPDSSLIGYYPFNGNANDESGYGYHGVVNGAVLTADRFGHSNSAYYFDGLNDFIEVANNNGHFNLQYLTVSAWIKPYNERINTYGTIVYKNAQTGYNRDNYLLSTKCYASPAPVRSLSTYYRFRVFFQIEEQSTSIDGNNYSPLSDLHSLQSWYLLTGVFNDTGVTIYINGVPEAHVSIQNIIPFHGPAPLIIGSMKYSTHPNGDFNGVIDDVRIYNRPLSASEISALYNPANGIAETANNTEISFYPNPVKDVLTINGIDDQNSQLSIYSVDGKLLLQKTLNPGFNEVNLNELDKGVYVLQIISSKNIRSERIIKQ
jgi:hypothetical protein